MKQPGIKLWRARAWPLFDRFKLQILRAQTSRETLRRIRICSSTYGRNRDRSTKLMIRVNNGRASGCNYRPSVALTIYQSTLHSGAGTSGGGIVIGGTRLALFS